MLRDVVHPVTPLQKGVRYSVTLHTPGKLEQLTPHDWDNVGKLGPHLSARP